MENLDSHGILKSHYFLGLESHGILVLAMESHVKTKLSLKLSRNVSEATK